METEFAFRHHNSDPERAAAVYESIKVNRASVMYLLIHVQPCLCNFSGILCLVQCLKAEDIASAVIYVLSAPAHVQVLLFIHFTDQPVPFQRGLLNHDLKQKTLR